MHLFIITKGKVLDFLFHMSGYPESESHLQVTYIRIATHQTNPREFTVLETEIRAFIHATVLYHRAITPVQPLVLRQVSLSYLGSS